MGSKLSRIRDDLEKKSSIKDFSERELNRMCYIYLRRKSCIGNYECVKLSSPSTVTRISFAVYRTVVRTIHTLVYS